MSDKCLGCGNCCGSLLPLTDKDIKRLKYLIKAGTKPARQKVIITYNTDLTCPFLTLDHTCSIYENRPAICKHYTCDKFKMQLHTKEEREETKGARPFDMWSLFERK